MTTVKRKGLTISVRDHAGYAEAGKDIVCAGVSALTNGLIQTVLTRPWLRAKVEVLDSLVCIRLRPWPFFHRGARHILDDYVEVCNAMSLDYPDNIMVLEVVE